MGIYIPGIEMPKGHGYVTITIWPSGTASYGLFDREENLRNYKAIKAVHVPPHGRLGDLDELHKEAVRRSEKAGTHDIWYNCTDRVICALDIKNAPTIVPEEEAKEKR